MMSEPTAVVIVGLVARRGHEGGFWSAYSILLHDMSKHYIELTHILYIPITMYSGILHT